MQDGQYTTRTEALRQIVLFYIYFDVGWRKDFTFFTHMQPLYSGGSHHSCVGTAQNDIIVAEPICSEPGEKLVKIESL